MGLLDILNGMQNGPRGPGDDSPGAPKGEGVSPMTMAVLALLAYKGYKHFKGNNQTVPAGQNAPHPNTTQANLPDGGGLGGGALGGGLGSVLGGLLGGGAGRGNPAQTGGIGDLLKGGLGGLLAGGAAGSILSGGLGDLMKQLQDNGQGEAAKSWVGTGENKQIAPDDLANALGADQIDELTSQTGMSRNDLLNGLSKQLPDVVDRLTPDGRLPTENEASRWV